MNRYILSSRLFIYLSVFLSPPVRTCCVQLYLRHACEPVPGRKFHSTVNNKPAALPPGGRDVTNAIIFSYDLQMVNKDKQTNSIIANTSPTDFSLIV